MSAVLERHIESLIFCSPEPISIEEMQQCISSVYEENLSKEVIKEGLDKLTEKYASEDFAFSIEKRANGYQFLTKPNYQNTISKFLQQKSKRKLSTSAMETLAIIAYKQPITKLDVENIRGVSCDYAVQRLLEKELVDIKGKADTVGKPILYGTSKKFMEYFGINSIDELPSPKDFIQKDNEVGEPSE